MSRVAVLVAVAVAVLAAGCGPSIGNPVGILPCTPSEDRLDKQMVLMAQSVPHRLRGAVHARRARRLVPG